MKTTLISLTGDLQDSLYQLGLKEQESFKKIEARVTKLLSTNVFLRQGQDILSRAKLILKKKKPGYFDQCIRSYAEGLGVDPLRYMSFLSLFEIAAHYGQIYPELKGMLPGCTSIFKKNEEGVVHSRLLDFPLTGLFEMNPRLYYWHQQGKPTILSYSCEGLAPLFFQGLHGSGISFALHHKPGLTFHHEGSSIFEIIFETLFETEKFSDFKKNLKKRSTVTKWCLLALNQTGEAQVMDLEGPALNHESFHLNEAGLLIFTNIPLHNEQQAFKAYIRFSEDRQIWHKEKLSKNSSRHILDQLTDVDDQKIKKWIHPGTTLSTVGAYSVNLTKGLLDLKEGEGALVASDQLVRFSLTSQGQVQVLKEKSKESLLESAWKRASRAQSYFDQGDYDEAYHELQMSESLMPHGVWKEIINFYLTVWDFKFVSSSKELALIYKRLLKIKVPSQLREQWLMMCARFEKKLGLMSTVNPQELGEHQRLLFEQEQSAKKPVFLTWMKLIYPRLEVLEIFSPHHK